MSAKPRSWSTIFGWSSAPGCSGPNSRLDLHPGPHVDADPWVVVVVDLPQGPRRGPSYRARRILLGGPERLQRQRAFDLAECPRGRDAHVDVVVLEPHRDRGHAAARLDLAQGPDGGLAHVDHRVTHQGPQR